MNGNTINNAEAYCYRSTKKFGARPTFRHGQIRKTEKQLILKQRRVYSFIDNETPHLHFIRQEEAFL